MVIKINPIKKKSHANKWLKILVKNLFKKKFNIIFIEKEKSYQNINFFFHKIFF